MKQYLDLLCRTLEEGVDRPDRTGVGTRGIFGQTLRFDMADGFPAMTTKKLAFNAVKAELLWLVSGSSTGLQAGEFVHVLGDTYIYHNHFDQVREQLTRDPYPLPKLWLNPEIKDIHAFTMNDIRLENYQSHPTIKAPMAVQKTGFRL